MSHSQARVTNATSWRTSLTWRRQRGKGRVSRCGPTAGGSLLLDLTQLCTPETDTWSGGIWDNVNTPPLRHLTLINADVMGFWFFLKTLFAIFLLAGTSPAHFIGLADQNSPPRVPTSAPPCMTAPLACSGLRWHQNPEDA